MKKLNITVIKKFMSKFYIAKHKPSNRYFKFNELCEDGWGFYVPEVQNIDLTSDYCSPSFFDNPEFPYINKTALNSLDFRNGNHIPDSDIEFFEVEIKISPIKT